MDREPYRAKLLIAAAAMPSRRFPLLLLSFCLSVWAGPSFTKAGVGTHAHAESASGLASELTSGLTSNVVAQVSLPSSTPLPAEDIPENLSPADITPDLRPEDRFPEQQPLPKLPPVDDLLGNPSDPNTPADISGDGDAAFVVNGIELAGSTVFTTEDFADLFAQYSGRGGDVQ